MSTQVIPLGESGKSVTLTRGEDTSKVTALLGGKEHGMTIIVPSGCPTERRRAAEERLVSMGVKSLMYYELLGTVDRDRVPSALKERYPGDDDFYLAWKEWEGAHKWEMP